MLTLISFGSGINSTEDPFEAPSRSYLHFCSHSSYHVTSVPVTDCKNVLCVHDLCNATLQICSVRGWVWPPPATLNVGWPYNLLWPTEVKGPVLFLCQKWALAGLLEDEIPCGAEMPSQPIQYLTWMWVWLPPRLRGGSLRGAQLELLKHWTTNLGEVCYAAIANMPERGSSCWSIKTSLKKKMTLLVESSSKRLKILLEALSFYYSQKNYGKQFHQFWHTVYVASSRLFLPSPTSESSLQLGITMGHTRKSVKEFFPEKGTSFFGIPFSFPSELRHLDYGICFYLLLWTELCSPIIYVKVLTPNVIVFGGRAFRR